MTGDTAPPRQTPLAERLWQWAFAVGIGMAAAAFLAGRGHLLPTKLGSGIAIGMFVWMFSWIVPYMRTWTTLPLMLIMATLLMRRSRMRFPGEVEALEALPETLPEATVTEFGERRAAIETLGLASRGLVRVSRIWTNVDASMPEMESIIECFRHASTGYTAIIMLGVQGEKPAPPGVIVRFAQLLPTDAWIAVIDSDQPGMFGSEPGDRGLTTPRGVAAPELHSMFVGLMSRFAPGWRPAAGFDLSTAETMREENVWTEQRWRRRGLIVDTDFPGETRYTWRATVGAAFRMVPGIHGIRRRFLHARYRRLRARWGV